MDNSRKMRKKGVGNIRVPNEPPIGVHLFDAWMRKDGKMSHDADVEKRLDEARKRYLKAIWRELRHHDICVTCVAADLVHIAGSIFEKHGHHELEKKLKHVMDTYDGTPPHQTAWH